MPPDGASDQRSMAAPLWELGELDYLLHDYQLAEYEEFIAWNEQRQTRAYRRHIRDIGGLFDLLWVDECGRRYGKSAKWTVTAVREAIVRPGCRGMIATAAQKSIGGIIVPLTKMLFQDAPPGYFPEYRATRGSDHECLYIPATDSIIKLVGVDKHPDATRGQFLDFCLITEAAFVKQLEDLVTSVINPQFRYRPWAWLAMETSTAKVPDCDFNRVFREDAKLRGCYRMRTIRDNPMLDDEEIEREERLCGGRESIACRRELYCEEVRDDDEMIVPEFDEAVHVVDSYERPRYALAHVGLDPGVTDPFGLVGFYLDWSAQCIVVEWSWMRSNASDLQIASTMQAHEREFWGTSHRGPRERTRELSVLDATTTADARVLDAPSDALTYWDQGARTLKANPYSRISDIDARCILNLNADYGCDVRKAEKGPGSAEANLQHLRTLFSARHDDGRPKIVIIRNGRTTNIIEQLRSGTWNTDEAGHRTDWERTKTLGHCDCLAALMYGVRDVKWRRNPNRPGLVSPDMSDRHMPGEQLRSILPPQPSAPRFGSGRRTFR